MAAIVGVVVIVRMVIFAVSIMNILVQKIGLTVIAASATAIVMPATVVTV